MGPTPRILSFTTHFFLHGHPWHGASPQGRAGARGGEGPVRGPWLPRGRKSDALAREPFSQGKQEVSVLFSSNSPPFLHLVCMCFTQSVDFNFNKETERERAFTPASNSLPRRCCGVGRSGRCLTHVLLPRDCFYKSLCFIGG